MYAFGGGLLLLIVFLFFFSLWAVYQESLFTASIIFRKNSKSTKYPLGSGLEMKAVVWD